MQRYLKTINIVCMGWFLFLATMHFFNARPMWNDELAVFESIEHFQPQQFFTHNLRAIQVFPRVYLFCIQQLSAVFDHHVLSLRFLPFVAMLSGFALWTRLARYEFKDSYKYSIYLFSWTASIALIYYSAELKQYSMDVLTAALYLMFLYHQRSLEMGNKIRYALILFLLPATGLVSYTAFLFLPFPLYNLLYSCRKYQTHKRFVMVYVLSMILFVGISYQFDMRLRPQTVIDEYERLGQYFVSLESFPEFIKSFTEGVNNLFSRFYADHPRVFKRIARFFVIFGLIFMFFAFAKRLKKDQFYLQSIDTIALLLFGELVLLGILKKYPFAVPRTVLFFCPIVLYLTLQGIDQLKNIHSKIHKVMIVLYLCFLTVVTLGLARNIILLGDLGAQSMIW